jgi:hypothetical protein
MRKYHMQKQEREITDGKRDLPKSTCGGNIHHSDVPQQRAYIVHLSYGYDKTQTVCIFTTPSSLNLYFLSQTPLSRNGNRRPELCAKPIQVRVRQRCFIREDERRLRTREKKHGMTVLLNSWRTDPQPATTQSE